MFVAISGAVFGRGTCHTLPCIPFSQSINQNYFVKHIQTVQFLPRDAIRKGGTSRWATDTFRDSVVQVNRSGRALNFVRQNCQLVCDPLLDWQPMQLVQ